MVLTNKKVVRFCILILVCSLLEGASFSQYRYPKASNVRLTPKQVGIACVGLLVACLGFKKCHDIDKGVLPPSPDAWTLVGNSKVPNLPHQFKMRERALTFVDTDFVIEGGQYLYGRVEESHFHWGQTYRYSGPNNEELAMAQTQVFSLWGNTIINIYDDNGNFIGKISENVITKFLAPSKAVSEYIITDAKGVELARSRKLEWVDTEFELHDPQGNVILKIVRSWYNNVLGVVDTWTVQVIRPGVLDPRLWVTIPAFKTYVDNKRAKESEEKANKNSSDDSDDDERNK